MLPIEAEDRRYKAMARCPKFEKCLSALCPLDPNLRHRVSVPGRPLCFWYDLTREVLHCVGIPSFVSTKLPIYIVHLAKCGALDISGGKT